MDIGSFDEMTRLLQASISPVAMVSGVGLLIMSLTNRFGRITDRLRELLRVRHAGTQRDERIEAQIVIFRRRARLLRSSISAAIVCVLLASVEILMIFVIAIAGLHLHHVVLILFALSLVCLITSLVLFLQDMHLALTAIEDELTHPPHYEQPPT